MIHDRETKTNLDLFMPTGWRLKTGAGHKTGRDKTGAYLPLSSSFVASAFVHVLVFFLISALISSRDNMLQNELIPNTLVDIRQGEEAQSPNEGPPSPIRKPLAFPPKPEKFNKPLLPTKREALKLERSVPPPVPAMAKEDAKPIEAKPILPAHRQQKTIFSSTATIEGGGSEAAGGNLFDAGDVGAAPGSGITGEGAGTAAAGLGRDFL